MTLAEILTVEMPTDDNLLDSWLLSKRETLSVLGVGGIGKSRFCLQLAICSLLGKDFLGLPTHMKGMTWLFLQTENSVRRTKFDLCGGTTPSGEHIHGMLEELTPAERHEVLNSISIQALLKEIDFQNYLNKPENIHSLRDEIKLANPDIIVWDPLINFFAGEDENSATQMEATLHTIKTLTRTANPYASSIVVHHGRGGKAGAAGAVGMDKTEFGRGSKALYNFVRGQINIAWGNEDEENPLLIMTCGKNNNGRPFKKRAIGLREHSMWYEVIEDFDWNQWHRTVTGKAAPKPVAGGRPLKLDDSTILIRVGDDWKKQKILAMEIKETMGISSDTTERRVKEMIADGLLDYRDEEQNGYKTRYIRAAQMCQ